MVDLAEVRQAHKFDDNTYVMDEATLMAYQVNIKRYDHIHVRIFQSAFDLSSAIMRNPFFQKKLQYNAQAQTFSKLRKPV